MHSSLGVSRGLADDLARGLYVVDDAAGLPGPHRRVLGVAVEVTGGGARIAGAVKLSPSVLHFRVDDEDFAVPVADAEEFIRQLETFAPDEEMRVVREAAGVLRRAIAGEVSFPHEFTDDQGVEMYKALDRVWSELRSLPEWLEQLRHKLGDKYTD